MEQDQSIVGIVIENDDLEVIKLCFKIKDFVILAYQGYFSFFLFFNSQ